jgi:hypothetical protein
MLLGCVRGRKSSGNWIFHENPAPAKAAERAQKKCPKWPDIKGGSGKSGKSRRQRQNRQCLRWTRKVRERVWDFLNFRIRDQNIVTNSLRAVFSDFGNL